MFREVTYQKKSDYSEKQLSIYSHKNRCVVGIEGLIKLKHTFC